MTQASTISLPHADVTKPQQGTDRPGSPRQCTLRKVACLGVLVVCVVFVCGLVDLIVNQPSFEMTSSEVYFEEHGVRANLKGELTHPMYTHDLELNTMSCNVYVDLETGESHYLGRVDTSFRGNKKLPSRASSWFGEDVEVDLRDLDVYFYDANYSNLRDVFIWGRNMERMTLQCDVDIGLTVFGVLETRVMFTQELDVDPDNFLLHDDGDDGSVYRPQGLEVLEASEAGVAFVYHHKLPLQLNQRIESFILHLPALRYQTVPLYLGGPRWVAGTEAFSFDLMDDAYLAVAADFRCVMEGGDDCWLTLPAREIQGHLNEYRTANMTVAARSSRYDFLYKLIGTEHFLNMALSDAPLDMYNDMLAFAAVVEEAAGNTKGLAARHVAGQPIELLGEKQDFVTEFPDLQCAIISLDDVAFTDGCASSAAGFFHLLFRGEFESGEEDGSTDVFLIDALLQWTKSFFFSSDATFRFGEDFGGEVTMLMNPDTESFVMDANINDGDVTVDVDIINNKASAQIVDASITARVTADGDTVATVSGSMDLDDTDGYAFDMGITIRLDSDSVDLDIEMDLVKSTGNATFNASISVNGNEEIRLQFVGDGYNEDDGIEMPGMVLEAFEAGNTDAVFGMTFSFNLEDSIDKITVAFIDSDASFQVDASLQYRQLFDATLTFALQIDEGEGAGLELMANLTEITVNIRRFPTMNHRFSGEVPPLEIAFDLVFSTDFDDEIAPFSISLQDTNSTDTAVAKKALVPKSSTGALRPKAYKRLQKLVKAATASKYSAPVKNIGIVVARGLQRKLEKGAPGVFKQVQKQADGAVSEQEGFEKILAVIIAIPFAIADNFIDDNQVYAVGNTTWDFGSGIKIAMLADVADTPEEVVTSGFDFQFTSNYEFNFFGRKPVDVRFFLDENTNMEFLIEHKTAPSCHITLETGLDFTGESIWTGDGLLDFCDNSTWRLDLAVFIPDDIPADAVLVQFNGTNPSGSYSQNQGLDTDWSVVFDVTEGPGDPTEETIFDLTLDGIAVVNTTLKTYEFTVNTPDELGFEVGDNEEISSITFVSDGVFDFDSGILLGIDADIVVNSTQPNEDPVNVLNIANVTLFTNLNTTSTSVKQTLKIVTNDEKLIDYAWNGNYNIDDSGIAFFSELDIGVDEDNTIINNTLNVQLTDTQSAFKLIADVVEEEDNPDLVNVDVAGMINYDTDNIFSMGAFFNLVVDEELVFSLFSNLDANEPINSPIVVLVVNLEGVTKEAFNAGARLAFRIALATQVGVDVSEVVIVRVLDIGGQKQGGVSVETDIRAANETEAAGLTQTINAVPTTALVEEINEQFEVHGVESVVTGAETSASTLEPGDFDLNPGSSASALTVSMSAMVATILVTATLAFTAM